MAIGGGGLATGVSTVFKQLSPKTKLIGVEPLGSPSMKVSMDEGHVVPLGRIDKFVDGIAVKRVGDLTFAVCRHNLDQVILVPAGRVCTTILQLYNEEAIVAEPAGALSIAALDFIRGKNVVCLVGGNNDITRTEGHARLLSRSSASQGQVLEVPRRGVATRRSWASVGTVDKPSSRGRSVPVSLARGHPNGLSTTLH